MLLTLRCIKYNDFKNLSNYYLTIYDNNYNELKVIYYDRHSSINYYELFLKLFNNYNNNSNILLNEDIKYFQFFKIIFYSFFINDIELNELLDILKNYSF
jgi:hypothetical protein